MQTQKEKIIDYFRKLDRSYFMEINKQFAEIDNAFPIGYGQTISQPSLVLSMTLLLDLCSESKVLEIGTGSGYQTALLAPFSKEVYTVERIEELHKKAVKRLNKLDFDNIYFNHGDGSLGWEENAPYDRIIVTAAASILPNELIDQLAPEGKMIIPVGPSGVQELLMISKDAQGKVHKELIEYVRFVRLIGKYE